MIIRPLEKRDWERVAWLASDEVQEGNHSTFEGGWIKSRRDFTGERVQSVVASDGQVVAYCSLERDPARSGWRAFIVLDWSKDQNIQEAAYKELEHLISARDVRSVWMRELAGDRALLDFMQSKDFSIEKRYTFDGAQMVNLERSYET